ncbi:MAG: MarR family transcriptional regulator [Oscillospiraceae bacterium]|nr:MarR family transcriptional regulator [Oscillospiraceae bacterium]
MHASGESIIAYLENIYHDFQKLEAISLASQRHTLSINEWHIIDKIGPGVKRRIGDLAASVGVTLASMTVAVDKLENKGYLVRERTPDDRRVVLLILTRRGRAAYVVHQRFHQNMLDIMLDGLSKEEIAVLVAAFEKLQRFTKNAIE